jgi:hypothetical protein
MNKNAAVYCFPGFVPYPYYKVKQMQKSRPIVDDLSNTQRFNSYTYANNNLMRFTDPTGYDGFDDVYLGPGTRTWNGINPEQDGNSGLFGSGGGGSDNGYQYDWATGQYVDGWGNAVSWDKVYNNYVVPNASYTRVVTGKTTVDRLTSLINILYNIKKLLNADYSISIGLGNDPITIIGSGVGVKGMPHGDAYAFQLVYHYFLGNGTTVHLTESRLYDIFDEALTNDAFMWNNAKYMGKNIFKVPTNFYKTDYSNSFGRAIMYIYIDSSGDIYPTGFYDLWDLNPEPKGTRPPSAENKTRFFNWLLKGGTTFIITYP